ncbi:PRC-barrel domain-containing protein [Tistlia consotensis]|uniref:PRC-barrel domain-containing protein n=1 Tax=Tistlia consotensis USBA 355 TaxID=560819 RepID=A0A1Y6CJ51_9PROT|nr:PRC-barrel domain-containing protein [Tistlia consotensis]SMF65393.1 PRC-barrel domain-containing protein [Tistlia consotensis USBA 355]SNS03749.1 PRC-barrel domain-containing protein [Tistlia consotensis]
MPHPGRVVACLSAVALAIPLALGSAHAETGDGASAPQQAAAPATLVSRITSRLEASLRASPLFDRPVGSIVGSAVYDAEGAQVGEAAEVARVGDNLVVLVRVGGGLFGIGSHQVAVPLVRFHLDGDRLVLDRLTGKKLKSLPAVEADNYEPLERGGTVAEAYRNG